MSKKLRNKVLREVADSLALVVNDLLGVKRTSSRKSAGHYKRQAPVVIIKVITESK